MALITGRQVWFYEDNIGPLRFGVVERASTLGRLIVRVTDGLDSLREIGIEPEQQVFYTEELAISCKKSYQFVKSGREPNEESKQCTHGEDDHALGVCPKCDCDLHGAYVEHGPGVGK